MHVMPEMQTWLASKPGSPVAKMELGSKLWSCSDLEKGLMEMNASTPDHEASLRKRIEETCNPVVQIEHLVG